MPLQIIRQDITKVACDAIVNSTNPSMIGAGGADAAIHEAAGPKLDAACKKIGGCPVGEARITKGYQLPCRYVIHTVGPIYSGSPEDPVLLRSCYINSLNLARKHDLHSIAFPAISAGVYGYPKKEAAKIAIGSVKEWLESNSDYDMDVIFSCFDQGMYEIYQDMSQICL